MPLLPKRESEKDAASAFPWSVSDWWADVGGGADANDQETVADFFLVFAISNTPASADWYWATVKELALIFDNTELTVNMLNRTAIKNRGLGDGGLIVEKGGVYTFEQARIAYKVTG